MKGDEAGLWTRGRSPDPWLTAAWKAWEADPDDPACRARLCGQLMRVDGHEQIFSIFGSEASRQVPDTQVLRNLGISAQVLGETIIAVEALSLALDKGCLESEAQLARIRFLQGDQTTALAIALHVLERRPKDYSAANVAFAALFATGPVQEVWEDWLPRLWHGCFDGNMLLPSALARASATVDQEEALRAFVDWENRFLATSLPDAQVDLPQLADVLMTRMPSGGLPRRRATVGEGGRIDAVHLLDDLPALTAILNSVSRLVSDYASARRCSQQITIEAWAIATTRLGHETWHVHPSAWLSGVLYLAVPDTKTSTLPNPGMIEFGPCTFLGEDESRETTTRCWPCRSWQPQIGEVLLFPSFFGHRTWPTGACEPRLCLAFDVMDKQPLSPAPSTQVAFWNHEGLLLRSLNVVCMETGEESWVLLHRVSGRCCMIDAEGLRLWNQLAETSSLQQLVDLHSMRQEGSREQIRTDLAEVLTTFIGEGMVEVSG
jgi:hypothetical protein